VINKPGLNDPQTCQKVVQTVRLMAEVPVVHHWRTREGTAQSASAAETRAFKPPDTRFLERLAQTRIIGIAASTGGPSALVTVLGGLPRSYPLPILVVQHITEGFTEGLAQWLGRQIQMSVRIAAHGEKLQPGVVYLAQDDYHLQVAPHGLIELTRDAPYKGLRPSANQLFHSLAGVYGRHALAIVLTGMGDDGALGAAEITQAQGLVIAQDEQSSVVYGMPREVKVRNTVDQVCSLDQITVILNHLARPGSLPAAVERTGN
jgi:two-component system chemotaxis response regulator CheB